MKKFLLRIIATFAALILLMSVIALFVKKEYTIIREISINSPVGEVYDYVRYHRNQKEFNHWISLDPNTFTEIRGSEDGRPGSVLYFESQDKKVGTGEWENTHFIENEKIELELRFLAPYSFTAYGTLHFVETEKNRSRLIWEYKSGMDWPMNISLLFMDMDKIIGKDIESTLEKIKFNIEK